MERVVEPELMDDGVQAQAYANADFEVAHSQIAARFDTYFPDVVLKGPVLDLGCGPGDITFRFAKRHEQSSLIGVDGSHAMISLANARLARENELADRV